MRGPRYAAVNKLIKGGTGLSLGAAKRAASPLRFANRPMSSGRIAGSHKFPLLNKAGKVRGPSNKVIMDAKRGRSISRMVAGGIVGATAVGGIMNRRGPSADPMGRRRPTGPYMF